MFFQYSRYGRDYYIKEAQKASGARKRYSELQAENQQRESPQSSDQVSLASSNTSSFNFINTAPSIKTLQSIPTHNEQQQNLQKNTKNFLMKKFLNDSNIQTGTPTKNHNNLPSRSASLNLKSNGRPKKYSHTYAMSEIHSFDDYNIDDDDNNISLSMFTPKRPHSISDFNNINEQLPPKIISELEENMLHRNIKRDSFISRKTTKNFVLNPIFDDEIDSGFHSIDHGTSKQRQNEVLLQRQLNNGDDYKIENHEIRQEKDTIKSITPKQSEWGDVATDSPKLVENVFINLNEVRGSSNDSEKNFRKGSPLFHRSTGQLSLRKSFTGRY